MGIEVIAKENKAVVKMSTYRHYTEYVAVDIINEDEAVRLASDLLAVFNRQAYIVPKGYTAGMAAGVQSGYWDVMDPIKGDKPL